MEYSAFLSEYFWWLVVKMNPYNLIWNFFHIVLIFNPNIRNKTTNIFFLFTSQLMVLLTATNVPWVPWWLFSRSRYYFGWSKSCCSTRCLHCSRNRGGAHRLAWLVGWLVGFWGFAGVFPEFLNPNKNGKIDLWWSITTLRSFNIAMENPHVQ